MAIQFDPRLQGKQNTTDILGQGAQTPQEPTQESQQAEVTQQPAVAQESPTAQNLATTKPSSSPRSGMFTNVNQYVEKNKPASENLARSIGDTVQRSADIARKNIQQTQQQFTNLKDQRSLQNRDTAVNEVSTAAQQAAGMQAAPRIPANVPQKSTIPTEQTQIPAQEGLSDADKRLRSILDASYEGPRRLQELSSFGQAQTRAQEAERLRNQLVGGNRQELLDKALERQGSRYTQGSRRLDELLFGQGEPQQYLQQRQQEIGNVGQDLGQAQQQASQEAIDRTREISNIRAQARQALQGTAQQRASEVEDYLTGQVDAGGQLVDYYQDILGQSRGGLDLGSIEAETLGVREGAGLYNVLRNDQEREALLSNIDARGTLDRNRLISRDQQSQLAELQRLAQLSQDYGTSDSGLDFRSQYQDADLAETQDALAALNLDSLGRTLTGAEERFREDAARDTTGVGKGKARYKKGLFRGRGTKRATAYETANLRDILEGQGYDFDSDPSQYVSDANVDLLRNLSDLSKRENVDTSDAEDLYDGLSSWAGEDNVLLDSLGLGGLGKVATLGGAIGTGAEIVEGLGQGLEDARILGDIGAGIGEGIKNIGREVGNFSDNIFGSGKSAARKKAKAQARKRAAEDLQRKLNDKFSSSGFTNRVNVSDTDQTIQRQRDLMDILGAIDARRAPQEQSLELPTVPVRSGGTLNRR